MWGISWQVVVLLSGLVSGAAQSIGKRLVNRHGAVQVGFWREGAGLALFVLMAALVGGSNWQVERAGWVFVYGLVLSVSTSAYFAAVREDFAGTVAFATGLGQIFLVVLSSIIFAEWRYFDPRTLVGVANLTAVAVGVGSFFVYQAGFGGNRVKWNKMVTLAVAVNVFGNLYVKYTVVAGMSSAPFLVYQNAGMLTGLLVLALVRGQSLRMGGRAELAAILQGLVGGLSVLVFLEILRTYPLSIASVVRRVATVVFTTSSGLWYFREKERLNGRRMAALVLGLVVFGLVLAVN